MIQTSSNRVPVSVRRSEKAICFSVNSALLKARFLLWFKLLAAANPTIIIGYRYIFFQKFYCCLVPKAFGTTVSTLRSCFDTRVFSGRLIQAFHDNKSEVHHGPVFLWGVNIDLNCDL